jgi:hypothetical protein
LNKLAHYFIINGGCGLNYLYIDESGDLGLRGSKYFLIVGLLISDFRSLNRILKKMRQNKFKKKLKRVNEIKANKSSFEIRVHMLKEFNRIEECQLFCVVMNKSFLTSKFLIQDKHKFYNYVAGHLANLIEIRGDLEIRIDMSKGKQMLRDDFDDYFRDKINRNSEIGNILIYHSYSHAWSGLQFADLIAWSYFQKFERNNSFYVNLLEHKCKLFKIWNKGK